MHFVSALRSQSRGNGEQGASLRSGVESGMEGGREVGSSHMHMSLAHLPSDDHAGAAHERIESLASRRRSSR